ncbi:SpoIID/LytB domain-containing protein [Leptolyngbya sp. AN03gr2]
MGLLVTITPTIIQGVSNIKTEPQTGYIQYKGSEYGQQLLQKHIQTSIKTLQISKTADRSSKSIRQAPSEIQRIEASVKPTNSKSPDTIASANTLEIRVAILESQSLEIASSTSAQLQAADQTPLFTLEAGTSYSTISLESNIQIGKEELPPAVWIDPLDPNEAIYVNGDGYRGKLLIVNIGDRLLVVNQVGLEDYITSVTGSEMYSHWSPEALKAQAIAARSYGLNHYQAPMNRYFDICSDEKCQVYKGIQAESSSAQAAALETQNQILVNPNQTPYLAQYSATAEITQSAHNGHGMPQIEAEKLALKGWNYRQILERYYPAATLALVSP